MTDLAELRLRTSTHNALVRAGITTVEVLCTRTYGDLFHVPGIGRVAAEDVLAALQRTGRSLAAHPTVVSLLRDRDRPQNLAEVYDCVQDCIATLTTHLPPEDRQRLEETDPDGAITASWLLAAARRQLGRVLAGTEEKEG